TFVLPLLIAFRGPTSPGLAMPCRVSVAPRPAHPVRPGEICYDPSTGSVDAASPPCDAVAFSGCAAPEGCSPAADSSTCAAASSAGASAFASGAAASAAGTAGAAAAAVPATLPFSTAWLVTTARLRPVAVRPVPG